MSTTENAARTKLQALANNSIEFRLLNALLTHAPTIGGRDVIATDIVAASVEPHGLEELAQFYKTGLLLPMRAGGKTPQVSFHPSRDPEIQTEANAITVDLETAKRDQKMLKKYTLHRDGYRCVVTRNWEKTSIRLRDVKGKYNPTTDTVTVTEAAHILPFSLMSADTNKTLFKKCTIWSVIKSFTNIEFTELNGDNINSLTNVLTLDTGLHKFFGPLDFWFEAVPGVSNTYQLRKADPSYFRDAVKDGAEVTFMSPNPELYPLPDPRYLAFHAAVAKVVHMAGMAEHLDEILWKTEDIGVLSDESGVEYLDGLLRLAQRLVVSY